MSDRECNYCLYQYILRNAKKDGAVVTTKLKDGGVDVFRNGEWICWFMELPDDCKC